MKPVKMREMTKDELVAQCLEAQKELFNLRIRQGAATVENPSRLRILRREIARMQTVLSERA